MSNGIVLQYVHPHELTADDLVWIEKANFAGPRFERLPLLQIEHSIRQSEMQLFRFLPGPGVLLTEILKSASGIKRLMLVRAAGEGVGWTFPQIADLLKRTAREWGCEGVDCRVYGSQRRLAEAMLKVGAKVESITMFLEAGDG